MYIGDLIFSSLLQYGNKGYSPFYFKEYGKSADHNYGDIVATATLQQNEIILLKFSSFDHEVAYCQRVYFTPTHCLAFISQEIVFSVA